MEILPNLVPSRLEAIEPYFFLFPHPSPSQPPPKLTGPQPFRPPSTPRLFSFSLLLFFRSFDIFIEGIEKTYYLEQLGAFLRQCHQGSSQFTLPNLVFPFPVCIHSQKHKQQKVAEADGSICCLCYRSREPIK